MTIIEQIREAELVFIKEWLKARTIFTFMFYATFIYLVLTRVDVPPALNTIISTLFGYWFGQKQTKKENV
jgi:uncharacterized membrane protein YfcA